MNPVLVELPNEVHKIQAFREGVNHPGWHAPVTLILDNSFVVINVRLYISCDKIRLHKVIQMFFIK